MRSRHKSITERVRRRRQRQATRDHFVEWCERNRYHLTTPKQAAYIRNLYRRYVTPQDRKREVA